MDYQSTRHPAFRALPGLIQLHRKNVQVWELVLFVLIFMSVCQGVSCKGRSARLQQLKYVRRSSSMPVPAFTALKKVKGSRPRSASLSGPQKYVKSWPKTNENSPKGHHDCFWGSGSPGIHPLARVPTSSEGLALATPRSDASTATGRRPHEGGSNQQSPPCANMACMAGGFPNMGYFGRPCIKDFINA